MAFLVMVSLNLLPGDKSQVHTFKRVSNCFAENPQTPISFLLSPPPFTNINLPASHPTTLPPILLSSSSTLSVYFSAAQHPFHSTPLRQPTTLPPFFNTHLQQPHPLHFRHLQTISYLPCFSFNSNTPPRLHQSLNTTTAINSTLHPFPSTTCNTRPSPKAIPRFVLHLLCLLQHLTTTNLLFHLRPSAVHSPF